MFDVAVFGSLFLTLFVIMDPPGITPIFLALTAGRPAKVQRRMAFQAVCVAGGVTVFAHPAASKRGRTVPESVIAELAVAGLDGIEVDHMDHDDDTRARLRGLAADLGLLVTGSSDYHGSRKTCVLGEYTTDPEVYGEITRRATGAFPVPGTGGA